VNVGDNTIEQVINDANEKRICLIDDKLIAFKENKEYLYNRVKDVKFVNFKNYMNTLKDKHHFQHSTKPKEQNLIMF
jgi:DNA helicase-2/ATP-dependent DNA helicase PcrA